MSALNDEINADLIAIEGEHPSSVTFTFNGAPYAALREYGKAEGLDMLPHGYDPDADFQLIVRLSALGATILAILDELTIDDAGYQIISLVRTPAFLTLNMKLIA